MWRIKRRKEPEKPVEEPIVEPEPTIITPPEPREYKIVTTYSEPENFTGWYDCQDKVSQVLEIFLEDGTLERQINHMLDIPLLATNCVHRVYYPISREGIFYTLELKVSEKKRTFEVAVYHTTHGKDHIVEGTVSW